KIPGSFYTGRGNEAASVGVATAMGADDVGTPLHRDMGVHVVRGVEPWRIFAQYMGRADGPTQGRDGNVHMADSKLGLDREDLLEVYRNMVLTRGIEERGHILYRQGKIPGSFYTGRGNEAGI